MIIYLDESGDLGFDLEKLKTTNYFVITILACNPVVVSDDIANVVRKTLRNKLNHKKSSGRQKPELKGSETDLSIKEYFLRLMPKNGWKIYSVTLDKSQIEPSLKANLDKKRLYNKLAQFIIKQVKFPSTLQSLTLVVDKCQNTADRKNFNQHLMNHLEVNLPLGTKIFVNHDNSQKNTGLQAVDMFCWGISRKYSHNDRKWYSKYEHYVEYDEIYSE